MKATDLYNSLNIAIAIKERSKHQGILIKDMLSDLHLGTNTMSSMRHGRMIASDSLAHIADYLDCSVDYLLGRTDIPSPTANIIDGNVTGGAVVQGSHHSRVTVNGGEHGLTDGEKEILRLYNSLDVKRRVKLLDFGFALEEELQSLSEKNK